MEEELESNALHLRLFEEKLRQTEKMTIMGMLASEIAHEVGTPLNIVLGRIELLRQREPISSKGAIDYQIMEQQIDRIRKIIDTRLHLTRKRSGNIVAVNIREMCEYLIELFKEQLNRGKIQVEIHVPKDLIIPFDEDELQQVLLNLLINAMQAMKQGGQIMIRARRLTSNGSSKVELVIQDTGKGIPPENLQKVFDPFFSTKKEEGGTGLGLAIVHSIVKHSGGEIAIESEVNRGTQFKIELPVD